MPPLAHGIDLVDLARLQRTLDDHAERFLERCFTPREQADADAAGKRRVERLAGRFAAKEAVLKALGTGWRHGIAWTDIEVVPDNAGAPTLRLTGQAQAFAEARGIRAWLISISHTDSHAFASVIALGAESAPGGE